MEQKSRPYSVVKYNSNWINKFKREQKIIAGIFKKKALKIEHIGSTSVRGMWAKPQIDVLVIVKNLRDVNKVLINKMESRGYTYQEDYFKDHKYFTRDAPSGKRLVSIHVAGKNSSQAILPLYFRDYLRKHPEDRKTYSKVKREAYEKGFNRKEYPKRKRKVLKLILKRAKKEYSKIR